MFNYENLPLRLLVLTGAVPHTTTGRRS